MEPTGSVAPRLTTFRRGWPLPITGKCRHIRCCYQLLREVCEVECGSKAALRPSKPTHAAERCHMQCGGKRLRKVPGSLERSRSACESGSCQSSRSRCDRVQCIDHLMRCIVRMAASADTPARYGAHASATERDYVWCRHYCGWECCGMGTRHHGITSAYNKLKQHRLLYQQFAKNEMA